MLKNLLFFLMIFFPLAASSRETIDISIFSREDCVHCQNEKKFLNELKTEFPQIAIHDYDILKDSKAGELFDKITSQYDLVKGTPITLVRKRIIQGYGDYETSGILIRKIIEQESGNNALFEDVAGGGAAIVVGGVIPNVCDDGAACRVSGNSFNVTIPILNKTIDVGNFSLGTLSIILGFIDGFNPCAMWVLVMFLIILSQLGSRKKMFQYAGLFILAESIMYYAILTVWITAWNFVGLNRYAIPFVALLSIGSGIYFLYKFITFKPECSVASYDQREKIKDRVKRLASNPLTFGVVLGILGLAFSVNIFEFACSIGIPQTFTKILDINSLSWISKQLYMFLYILMYMVDDVIVFGIALYSIDKIGITGQYSRWSSLIGGILMLILGTLLFINPSWLIF